MTKYVFVGEQGLELGGEAGALSPDAVIDGLILGTVEGVTPSHAFLILVRGNRALLDAAHDEVLCTQMASAEMETFHLHDLRPSADDTEAKAIFKAHLLDGEPLSEDEVEMLLAEGIGSPEDWEQRGGECYWFGPAFPLPEEQDPA
jgi:hypothetical protein